MTPLRALGILVSALLVSVAGAGAQSGVVKIFTGTGISRPVGIAAGPDGNLWFTNNGSLSIGRITTGGVVTDFLGAGIPQYEIAAGPDGALWFTKPDNNTIGRITTGGLFTGFSASGIFIPTGIAAGPDGNLWFTNVTNNSIGRITTSGTVTIFAPTGAGISSPGLITAGADGAFWFTNVTNNSIGRITTAGTVTNFTGPGISNPAGIAAGPDGALWFTNGGNNSIGRITIAGTVTNFTGTGISGPLRIAAGPDGALWFTNQGNDSIGRITTAGAVTNFTGAGINKPWGIAAGPDCALWFTNSGTNSGNSSIGRIEACTPPPPPDPCKGKKTMKTYLAGKVDNFARSNGVERATKPNGFGRLSYFDSTIANRQFWHEFGPKQLGWTKLCGAKLQIRVRPLLPAPPGKRSGDDMITLTSGTGADKRSWQQYFADPNPVGPGKPLLPGRWVAPRPPVTFTWNWDRSGGLPAGRNHGRFSDLARGKALFEKLDSSHVLDVHVQDDTSVDYVKLTVWVK